MEQQIDSVVQSLQRRLRRPSSSTKWHTAEEMPAEQAPFTPFPSSASPVPNAIRRRGSSLRSRSSLKRLRDKLFDNRGDAKEGALSGAHSEEEVAWTAPASPLTAGNGTHRRRNSARLRELQRLMRAFHQQRDEWLSPPNSPRPPRRGGSELQVNGSTRRDSVSAGFGQSTNVAESILHYSRGELGPERPMVLPPEEQPQSGSWAPPTTNGRGAMRVEAAKRISLSELELALLEGTRPSYPSSLHSSPNPAASAQPTTSSVPSSTASPRSPPPARPPRPPPTPPIQRHTTSPQLPHRPFTPQRAVVVQTANNRRPEQKPPMSPRGQHRQRELVSTQKVSSFVSEQISIRQQIGHNVQIDSTIHQHRHPNEVEVKEKVRKSKRTREEEHRQIVVKREERQQQQPQSPAAKSPSTPQKAKSKQQAKRALKGPGSLFSSGSLQQLLHRHRKRQQNAVEEGESRQTAAEPQKPSEQRSARDWNVRPSYSRPGSPLAGLSLAPSTTALEHLELLRERVAETKYVTAVFESRGGLGPVLEDVQCELEHWLGLRSKLLAVACEVHWSVPERFRSRHLEIQLKESLHASLRENNRRVLSLNDDYNNSTESTEGHSIQQRSHSAWTLNRPLNRRPGLFPIALARSRTEESCARDAELDTFQGIYRRFYPALLSLQDPATVKAHKGYWTVESLTDERRAPLVPNPERFLYQPVPGQLARKSLVAVNMAVLRMSGDDRDYDADEGRERVGARPTMKESDL